MSCETVIAIIGICASSIMAGVGLILNWSALKQNNKITCSTKLAEASKLLSDELLLQIRLWKYYESEAKETEKRLCDSPDKAREKLNNLNRLINNSLERQEKIDKETLEIEKMFSNLDNLDIAKVDSIISVSYRLKTKVVHQLEFVKEQTNGN